MINIDTCRELAKDPEYVKRILAEREGDAIFTGPMNQPKPKRQLSNFYIPTKADESKPADV